MTHTSHTVDHISKSTKKLNQKPYVYNNIRTYLSSTVSETYLQAIVFSHISYCLPIRSLTTEEVTEPIARLYNQASKIHSNLPKWTHHCTALTLMLSDFTFNSNTVPHKHSSLSYQCKTCPKGISLDELPWRSTQCLHTIMAMGRGPSCMLSPKSGRESLNTLEHYNPSHSSKNAPTVTPQYLHLQILKVYRPLCVFSLMSDMLCSCYVLYVNLTCDVPFFLLYVICTVEQEPAAGQESE